LKRQGYLFDAVLSFSNLCLAARKAYRGKKYKKRVAKFYFHMETELIKIQEELKNEKYLMKDYRKFFIYEPKKREISAAGFRDRVVHHALCNVIGPISERSLIYDTYACRLGKGQHRAVRRVQYFANRYSYYLKLDIKKYFDNIDHQILKSIITSRIKDNKILGLINKIIDHKNPGQPKGKGIPIGNLTSQYFANLYLGNLDHYIKEKLKIKGYIRYMDDMIIFENTKKYISEIKVKVGHFIGDKLKLELKENVTILAPIMNGIPFLGFRVYPKMIRIKREGWQRFKNKVGSRERDFKDGKIDQELLCRSVSSLLGHVIHADTLQARKRFFEDSIYLG